MGHTSTESILVIGHRNPDMDAIASAVGYAWVLNHAGHEPSTLYVAGRTGEVNAQTAFALHKFGVEAPPLVSDVWAHVGNLAQSVPPLRKGQTLLEACQSIARSQRSAPVVDSNKVLGLISGAGLFGILADALGSTSVIALANELNRPVENIVDLAGPVLIAEERVRDVLTQALRSEQDEFIVTDDQGNYVGLCRKSDLLAPPRRKLVIVDHNELSQAVSGLEEAELVEVLDHHRLGNLPTTVPIRFHVDPVGSCSTLVTEQALDANLTLPPQIAGLLLCGIMSDTLVFRSPTTTERDRAAGLKLTEMAQLQGDSKQAIEVLGQELLSSGAGIGARSAEEVINGDLKFYETNGITAGIAQVEVTNFGELSTRLPEIKAALAKLADTRNLELAVLMVTDVVRGNSRLVLHGQPRIVGGLPYARLDDDTLDASGVVSRKKQLLPAVLAALGQIV